MIQLKENNSDVNLSDKCVEEASTEDEMARGKDNKTSDMLVLGFDFSRLSPFLQFMYSSLGIFVFYLIYGYMQELIFRLDEFKPYGWYLTLIQFAIYSLISRVEFQMHGPTVLKTPISTYGLMAFLTVATMGLSNASVGYLNYPTQVLFKCCKLIPTMIGGVLIQGKTYGIIDVAAVFSMVVGLIFFILADTMVQPRFNFYGVLLISLALCADGAIGNVQEKTMKRYNCSNAELVFYSYSFGFVMLFVGLCISGQVLPAFNVCMQYPLETYGYGFVFSITGYVGIQFVLVLVRSFGALPAVTVTTCRKAVTIILSFFMFKKPFTPTYLWSGLLVVLGIYLSLYSKNKEQWNASARRCLTNCRRRAAPTEQTVEHIV